MSPLHLVRLVVNPIALKAYAVAEGLEDDDGGYALHKALRSRYGTAGPQPFRLLEAERETTLLGYAAAAPALLDAAALPALDPRFDQIFPQQPACRPMPSAWRSGQRLRFDLRARPLTRYGSRARAKRGAAGLQPAGERDAFLAAIEAAPPDQHVDRNTVYCDWLEKVFGNAAVTSAVRITAMRRLRVRRSAHAGSRTKVVEGYEVVFAGELEVSDPEQFARLLTRGVGRHTAFGFGMLLLRPPGRP